jgi:hypothetical protein
MANGTTTRLQSRRGLLTNLIRLTVAIFLCCSPVLAQAPSSLQVEAAFLFKFIGYVDWPEQALGSPDKPFVIGVLGTDPFGASIDEDARDEKAKGRKIEVHRYSSVGQISNCQILFISSSESRRLPSILDKLKGRSILTVSDLPDFARAGGMIGFVTQNNKIRFQINRDAAQQARVNISAKLLQLAQIVYPNPRP